MMLFAVFANENIGYDEDDDERDKVPKNESQRKASRFGVLSTLWAEIAFELGAAVEAFCGVVFGLVFSLYFGLYFVLHDVRV